MLFVKNNNMSEQHKLLNSSVSQVTFLTQRYWYLTVSNRPYPLQKKHTFYSLFILFRYNVQI